MKRFITTAPRQEVYYKTIGRGQYALDEKGGKVRAEEFYAPVDCEYLRYDSPCCYPIIPMINAFVQAGDEVEVIVLTAPLPMCEENLRHIGDDVAAICTQKGASGRVKRFDVPLDETIGTHLNAFERLIACFEEGDVLYGDMTYGSKPSMYMMMMALNYAHQAMRSVYVECVAYGEMVWDSEQQSMGKRIFDCTRLFLMDQIVNSMGRSGVDDPAAMVSSILSFDPDEEV